MPRARLERPACAASFDLRAFLASAAAAATGARYGRGETIFIQGDLCRDVMYLESGAVKLSVLSRTGREAVVAVIAPGEFFGEGCLAGQVSRVGTATAMTPSTTFSVRKHTMARLLHEHHGLSDRFLAQMLTRNVRIEEDLIEQFFDSNEKRLARALLLLAHYGTNDPPSLVVPKVSRDRLAEMIGATPTRVAVVLNQFKRLGFIEYTDVLKVNRSLLTVLLHD